MNKNSYVLQHYNIPMDYLTMGILLWNFAVVGIIAVFWHGHVRINQGYLIFISGLLVNIKKKGIEIDFTPILMKI